MYHIYVKEKDQSRKWVVVRNALIHVLYKHVLIINFFQLVNWSLQTVII